MQDKKIGFSYLSGSGSLGLEGGAGDGPGSEEHTTGVEDRWM